MTNNEIIYSELKTRGLTDEQLQAIVTRCNGDLPFHTIPEWSRMGYHVKQEEAESPLFECYLWKHTNKPSKAAQQAARETGEDVPERSPHFYQRLCKIYGPNQIERTAPAPDLATLKARLDALPGLAYKVKGEKAESPNVWITA